MFTGCSGDPHTKLDKKARAHEAESSTLSKLTVYFSTCNGYMVPITYPLNQGDEPVRTAAEILLEGPKTEYLFRTIPKGTRLKDCYVSDGTAFIDFTKEFNKLSNSKETSKAVKSLCLTMGSIPGVDTVQVLIDGKIIDEIHGIPMGQMLKHSWVNYSGSGYTENKYVVYYVDSSGLYMVPVTYASETGDSIPQKAIERLVTGPADSCLTSPVWPGTRLLNLKIEKGLATVDLSEQAIGYGGGTTAESLFVKSILLTLGQFSDIKAVQFLIEGDKVESLPEGTQVGIPLEPIRDANPYLQNGVK
jgi:germination protein M